MSFELWNNGGERVEAVVSQGGRRGAIYSPLRKIAIGGHLGRSLQSGETGVSGLRQTGRSLRPESPV